MSPLLLGLSPLPNNLCSKTPAITAETRKHHLYCQFPTQDNEQLVYEIYAVNSPVDDTRKVPVELHFSTGQDVTIYSQPAFTGRPLEITKRRFVTNDKTTTLRYSKPNTDFAGDQLEIDLYVKVRAERTEISPLPATVDEIGNIKFGFEIPRGYHPMRSIRPMSTSLYYGDHKGRPIGSPIATLTSQKCNNQPAPCSETETLQNRDRPPMLRDRDTLVVVVDSEGSIPERFETNNTVDTHPLVAQIKIEGIPT